MAFKPNYNQQRAERNRAKQAKAEAKAREREEQVARRKAGLPDLEGPDPGSPDLDAPDTEPAASGSSEASSEEPVTGPSPTST